MSTHTGSTFDMDQGKTLRLRPLHAGLYELCFDRRGESHNRFDALAIEELRQAVAWLGREPGVRGLLLSSAKDAFAVGADLFELRALCERPEAEIRATVARDSAVFTALSQLPFPCVAALNGLALGGGFEAALACDHRVMADTAALGLPEVGLGIVPGYGGSVRLPRIAGSATALQWIAGAATHQARAALSAGAVDAVVPPQALRDAALAWLRDAAAGAHDWRAARERLNGPAPLDATALDQARAAARTAGHNPAAAAFVQLLVDTTHLDAPAALQVEALAFARLAKTPTAAALLHLFANGQLLKKQARSYAKQARPVRQGAVLGAGIMGGGIAYTGAVHGTPMLMKDITAPALELGLAEADRQLARQVAAGRLPPQQARQVRAAIRPQLDYAGFDAADLVVEAVVEDLAVKRRVLAELEAVTGPQAVIASNTSSLSITEMAQALQRPQRFVGMHFFNPVPQMPLVEVILGPATDPAAAATAAAMAVGMGKTPIVVRDCPGFLVNRCLIPYCLGFLRLVHDGADYRQVDRVMEAFGWPMGPAYLHDVIGMDTLVHVLHVITTGYGARMASDFPLAAALLLERGRLGQKSGAGFYRYEPDARGKPRKLEDKATAALLSSQQPRGARAFGDEEIVDRLMLPMVLEAARCLDEGVVGSAAEVDMGLILGLGFPRHLGGPLFWADRIGLREIVRRSARCQTLSPLYEPAPALVRRAEAGQRFHG
jgi:3-hydroxyacyl-CoA dehydrogenase/enoyl-CoA hydratase/3-hydroxybutyryl-CoA epimerase/enoyl-CoA isomerase